MIQHVYYSVILSDDFYFSHYHLQLTQSLNTKKQSYIYF